MLPTEQERFFACVGSALSAYGRYPEQRDLEAWWRECKGMTLEALEAAFKSHREDPERGERAPRPVDITRRMKAGSRNAQSCDARDFTGQCQYPGIFGDGTSGDSAWFCPWHRVDRTGPEASRWIQVSREVPYEDACRKRVDRMHGESIRSAQVVNRAHEIALRHGNRPWQVPPLKLPFNGELSAEERRILDQHNLDSRAA